jgi:hypothetical protein
MAKIAPLILQGMPPSTKLRIGSIKVRAPEVVAEEHTSAIDENLIAVGYADVTDDHLFLRSEQDNGVADYKSGRRAYIESTLHVAIIANIGDQQSDLDGKHADRPFKLPNPFYFIPSR